MLMFVGFGTYCVLEPYCCTTVSVIENQRIEFDFAKSVAG